MTSTLYFRCKRREFALIYSASMISYLECGQYNVTFRIIKYFFIIINGFFLRSIKIIVNCLSIDIFFFFKTIL